VYSVNELAKMFNVARNTIYSKLNSSELVQYVKQTEQGVRLEQEGLSVLQLLLVSTSSKNSSMNKAKIEQNDYLNKYVEHLEQQIETLKSEYYREKQELIGEKKELQKKYDSLVNIIIEQQLRQQKMLEDAESKKKRRWFGLFNNGSD